MNQQFATPPYLFLWMDIRPGRNRIFLAAGEQEAHPLSPPLYSVRVSQQLLRDIAQKSTNNPPTGKKWQQGDW